jgi:hypothetical protein
MGKGGHGAGMAGAGHSHDSDQPEDSWNLYQHIERVDALNATVPADSAGIFKPHAYRLQTEPCLVSDSDEEILIKVSFASPVHIRRIMVIGGGEADHHPSSLQLFVNSEEIDFSSAEDTQAAQEFDLAPNVEGEGFVTTRQGPFTNVTSVAFFFNANHGDVSETKIQYIGMQGDHTHDKRKAVNAVYELNCVHRDTSVKNMQGAAEGV